MVMVGTRIHSVLDMLTVVVTFCLQTDNMRRMHRDSAREIDVFSEEIKATDVAARSWK